VLALFSGTVQIRLSQNTEVIEEIVQDIFVDLWKQRQKLNSNQEIFAFLNALLRNKVLHEWRANSILAKHAELYSKFSNSSIDESLPEHLGASEIKEKLNAAMVNLSPRCRQAFELSRYEELSYKEISERMAISVKTVEKHIGKALKILKVVFNEYRLLLIFTIHLIMDRYCN